MKTTTIKRIGILLILATISICNLRSYAVTLWVGQTYTWDFGGSILGSTYNLRVSSNGGYLSITGSGFYRNITPTQYFSGNATITAEWDYSLYYGDKLTHQKVTLTVSCRENPVSISPKKVTLSPGETYQLGYRHAYDNEYVGAAGVYFSGGNNSFSVSSSGLITAKSPGDGYVNVYSKVSNAANSPSCYVLVKEVEPTGASTNDYSLYADQYIDLDVNVSPSNATVKSKRWYVKSGDDVVSISGDRLTGLKPGVATIYCKVNNSVRSNDANVTVREPELKFKSSLPNNDAKDISVYTNPAVVYSHSVKAGSAFDAISLYGNGAKVDGQTEISDKEVRFLPTKPLSPLTRYTLTIPRNAVINKWGSSAQSDVSISFTTADYEKATVVMSPVSGSYITSNDRVTLTANPSDAIIYYTLDGSNPTAHSQRYTEPLKLTGDATVKALAVREGYKNSDIVTGTYYKSQSEIIDYYPNNETILFNYASVNPYLTLNGTIEKSNNFRRITLTDSIGTTIPGKPYLTDYMVIFVPDEPLANATTYTMDIPRDAIKTSKGEIFKGFTWNFTTPVIITSVALQGDNSVYVLDETGKLKMRGLDYQKVTPSNGSYTYKDNSDLTEVLTGVEDISCGYTHRLVTRDAVTKGYGLAFCGESGTTAGINAIGSIKQIKSGFQTSAIIAEDNSLWMSGRNDFYQLCDSTGSTAKDFIKVAENVLDVAPGNGYTLYVDCDNVLWGVGRNHLGQLGDSTTENRRKPVKIMEGVAKVYSSASGYFSACITTGNSLLTWGDNSFSQLGRVASPIDSVPREVMSNVTSCALGEAHILALTETFDLYAWGSNSNGQIGDAPPKVDLPKRISDNVRSVCAGPNTSLILYNSGKVTGNGKKSHNNFGSGEGSARNYVVDPGLAYSKLESVGIKPLRFETKPGNEFAMVSYPQPYAADYDIIEWESSNPNVAMVTDNGIIHTYDHGEAKITVRFTDRFGTSKEAVATVVCTDNPNNSGVENITSENRAWTVSTNGLQIHISNAKLGETFHIYNTHGIEIACIIAESENLSYDVPTSGVYIVQSTFKAEKVFCR